MITTKYHPRLIESRNRFGKIRTKPIEICEYNQNIARVDRSDQLIAYYSCPRKTIRWYKKVIFHLLDLAVLNSFILYRKSINNKITLLEFRNTLIKSLIGLPPEIMGKGLVVPKTVHDNRRFPHATKAQAEAQPGTVEQAAQTHFLEKIPTPPDYKRKTYCMDCRQCTIDKKRTQTSWQCKGCANKPPLCPGCFEKYHI